MGDANDFAFPENRCLPWECCFSSRSSGEKRQLRLSSLLLLHSPPSHEMTLSDLLVVATPARLDPRPGRSYSSTARDPCQEVYSRNLVSGQKGCERD